MWGQFVRVLIVDDNVDGAYVLALLLKELGCAAETCQDPSQCVAIAQEVQPNLILLDLVMPKHNGFEVAETLRDAQLSPFMLVALSGRGEQAIRDRCKTEGFDDFILKPASVEQLRGVLAHAERRSLNLQEECS